MVWYGMVWSLDRCLDASQGLELLHLHLQWNGAQVMEMVDMSVLGTDA